MTGLLIFVAGIASGAASVIVLAAVLCGGQKEAARSPSGEMSL